MSENKEESSEKESSTKPNRKKSRKIKKTTIKKISTIIVLLAILAVIFYFALKTLKPKEVMGSVNGEKISKQDFEEKYSQLPDQYKLFITEDDFLDQMINVKLLLQEAKKVGVTLSEDEIEREVINLKNQAPTEEAFTQLLEQQNLDLDGLKKQLNEQLIINKLLNKTVLSKIEISDSKIREYYDNNEENFIAGVGQIRIRHILVEEEEQAEQLLEEIGDGADFAELAKLNSVDTISAIQGGDLGFTSKGQMVKEFEDAAFSLREGQLSSPVKTQFGFHIIKRELDNIPFSESKERIRQLLKNELSQNALEIYINQLSSEADIIKKGIKITKKIETFTKTDDPICMEEGKVIIRLFSTTKNAAANWIRETFDSLADEYEGDIVAYHWQLDTGDNTLTKNKESGISKAEVELFKKYNPKHTVPTYVFGCKYVRIGNAYPALEEEKSEFKKVIEILLS